MRFGKARAFSDGNSAVFVDHDGRRYAWYFEEYEATNSHVEELADGIVREDGFEAARRGLLGRFDPDGEFESLRDGLLVARDLAAWSIGGICLECDERRPVAFESTSRGAICADCAGACDACDRDGPTVSAMTSGGEGSFCEDGCDRPVTVAP